MFKISLVQFKKQAEADKEYQKHLEEEKKHPPGTKLLSEEERLSTLDSLKESKNNIMNLLEKMPMSMRTLALQNRKTELENKINEIEEAIKQFSRKNVYIKVT